MSESCKCEERDKSNDSNMPSSESSNPQPKVSIAVGGINSLVQVNIEAGEDCTLGEVISSAESLACNLAELREGENNDEIKENTSFQ